MATYSYGEGTYDIPGYDPFKIPTPGEAYGWASGLPGFQNQYNLLQTMMSPQSFQQQINPYMQNIMKGLGRSGMGSSSYADRIISNTLGSLWSQNLQNTLGGYQGYMSGMAPWAQGYQQSPFNVLNLMQGI